MPARFYAPPPARLIMGELVTLPAEEAQHLGQVLRGRPGLIVHLFDGKGRLVEGVVESIARRDAVVRVTAVLHEETPPRLTPELHLACAIPKGDRARWMMEKLTELDVDSLTPLETTRSVVEPGSGKLEKFHQTVLAACKQSRRNRLMTIHSPISWSIWLASLPADEPLWIADPNGEPLVSNNLPPSKRVHVAIGPEGGLTDDEISEGQARGARLFHLGSNILRIETAAVAIAAWFALLPNRSM